MKDNLTPMLQQYYSIKNDYEDAILFFRLGDFYEMFGSDAETASRVLDIALTGRDMGQGRRLPMCGVPHHAADGYLAKLIKSGFKVAICDQVGDPKTSKGIVERKVTRVITPGTVIEPEILDDKSNNFLVAVSRQNRNFGLAVADISTGYFGMTEFRGEKAFTSLIDELNRLQPAECLLEPGLEKEPHWQNNDLAAYSLSPFENRAWRWENARTLLKAHFGVQSLDSFGIDAQMIAIKAGGALLAYLEKTQKRSISHISKVVVYSTDNYMLLETTTRRNLELTQTMRDGEHKGSLLWLLDETVTAMGARLLKQWLLQPGLDKLEIQSRLDAVEEFVEKGQLRDRLREQLAGIYDIERLVGRVTFGSANPRELVALRESLKRMPTIFELVGGASCRRLKNLLKNIDILPDITDLLEQSLVDEPPVSSREGGIIAQGYFGELDDVRLAADEGKTWITDFEAKERQKTGIRSLKVGFNRIFGYYIEVTRANLDHVPSEYERKQTLANSERYITVELKEKESQVIGAEERAVELEYELFVDIRDQVAAASARLLELAQTIGELDVLLNLAEIAVARNYSRPTIVDEPIV
ncbi:MAG: DNA mismatch repair protein MutS, partial [Firmicutes bacterium]|nr:DNA mismatch repair protein MutS [Bacillota bacterium]